MIRQEYKWILFGSFLVLFLTMALSVLGLAITNVNQLARDFTLANIWIYSGIALILGMDDLEKRLGEENPQLEFSKKASIVVGAFSPAALIFFLLIRRTILTERS